MNAMKTLTRITVQILLFLLIAFTVIMSFHACQKIESPTKGVKLIVNYDLLKTYVNIRFYDAATGQQIGMDDGKQVSVNITGESASAVIDMEGESGKTYKSGGGYMTLYLNPNVEFFPSLENPIRFSIVAQLEGYMQASRSMVITENGDYFVDISMVQTQLPPEGVVVTKEGNIGNAVQGEIQEDISVKTNGDLAGVFIPKGTVLKDENGNVLSGSLNIEITHFDNLKDQSLASFPGGLMSGLKKNESIKDGVFYTVGFVSVEIKDNSGKQAKIIEGEPMALTLMVPEQTFNPQTSSTVNSGDYVSVQSYDPEEGVWNYEQASNIESVMNGMEVTAWLNHLSYWNFGWFYENSCETGVEIAFTGDQSGCECVNVQGIMRKTQDDTFLRYVNMEVCDGETVIVTNAPANIPVYIEWSNTTCYNYFVDPAYNPLHIVDLCNNNQYDVPLLNESGQITNISIDVTARCDSYPDVEVHPTFGFWFRESAGNCWRYGFMYDGKANICDVEIGKDYVIGAYYENSWNEWEVTVTQSEYVVLDMELPDGVCNTLFD